MTGVLASCNALEPIFETTPVSDSIKSEVTMGESVTVQVA